MEATPFPLSSRAQPRDLQFSPPATGCTWKRHPSLCHPERSRGICSSLHQPPDAHGSDTLPFVIPSAAEGSAVLSTSHRMHMEATPFPLSSRAQPRDLQFSPPATGCTWKRHPSLCHPERSRGICSSLHQPPDAHGSDTLPFVIPSAAEGSAVSTSSSWKCFSRKPVWASRPVGPTDKTSAQPGRAAESIPNVFERRRCGTPSPQTASVLC